ncbi:MAG: FkbM family methyltransferase [Propylenella sp.]
MGFNFLRWLSDPGYRSLRRWRAIRGDETLRLNYPLTSCSVVIDAGAYLGDFAARVSERFGCTIHAFEPVPDFARRIRGRSFPSPVYVHEYGLSDHDSESDIALADDATGLFGAGPLVKVRFRDVAGAIESLQLERIALLKLNVEGSEYAILERLIRSGSISSIGNIQVQFHRLRRDDARRYRRIARQLRRTHSLTWRFPFVWESWRLLDAPER